MRINPFRTEEYEKDLELVRDLADYFDVVMLAKAGEAYGAPEIRDLSAVLVGLNHRITIQPIIEHPKSLKIAPELMQYATVKHVVFGIHDFSKAMGIHITPRHWTEELKFYLHDILFEARIAGKGVIGGVETLIGQTTMPENFVEPDDVRRWLDLHGDEESRVVYKHACEEASMGLSGKQVIHPSHIHPCKVAFTPSPSEIKTKIAILKAADRGRRAARRRHQVPGRDARPADVRQGAADAAARARAARALARGHRLRDGGAQAPARAGGARELAVRSHPVTARATTAFAPFPPWKWEVPERLNIGVACTDAHLGTPAADRVAMIVEDDALGTSAITYRELAARTSRFAAAPARPRHRRGRARADPPAQLDRLPDGVPRRDEARRGERAHLDAAHGRRRWSTSRTTPARRSS